MGKPPEHDDTPNAGDELLAAYVDGVGELAPAERRAIEARLPALREEAAATRALLGQLRELPAEGEPPDWTALAKRISAEVGDALPARPWWRRLLLPATAALALAAAAALWLHGSGEPRELTAPPPAPVTAAREPVPAPAPAPALGNTVYLDGEAVDVADLDGAALADEEAADDADIIGGALLPTPDLAWIDDLDTDSLASAERWLADRKGT